MPGSSLDDSELSTAGSNPGLDPTVIVVKDRARGLSPWFLPPFFLATLAVGFLGYRVAASDWRGFSWDVVMSPALAPKTPDAEAPVEVARVDETPATSIPEAKPPVAEPVIVASAAEPLPEMVLEAKSRAESLEEIRRESEKARLRKEEMEKTKEAESKKLDATKQQREQAATKKKARELARRGAPFQFRAMTDAEMRTMEKRFREQWARMEQNQRQFEELGLDFGRNAPNRPGRQPGVPGPDLFMGMPRQGMNEFQEFRGPGGAHGFVFRRQFHVPNPGFQIEPKPDEIPERR